MPAEATNYGSIGRVAYYNNVVKSQEKVKTPIELALEKAAANNQSMQNKPQYALDISNEELLRGAIEKYGALPKGEQPRAREVDIPKRTYHGKTA